MGRVTVMPASWQAKDLRAVEVAAIGHSIEREEKATSSHGEWLAWDEPRAVRDLAHVETFFARNLGGLIHARTRVPARLAKATAAR